MELTDYQRDILIRTALGEAAGEGKEGMAAVLHVILNRANSGQFPSDPAEVALQNKQFSTWNKGEGGNNPQKWSENSKSYRTAAAALDGVLSAKSDPTGGALYYHAKGVTPYWADDVNKNGVVKIGAHRFYPSHPVPKANIPDVASATDFGPGIPTPMLNRKPVVADDNRRIPTAAQTAAEQRLMRPDYRSMGFVPLPAPAPLRAPSGPQRGVGTSTLAPPTKVQTVRIDPMTNQVMGPDLQAAVNAKAARIASGQEKFTPTTPAPVTQPLTRDTMWFGKAPVGPGPLPPSPFEKKPNIAAAGLPIAAALDAKRALDALMPKPAAPVPQKAPIYPPTTVRAPTLQDAMDEQALMRRIPTAPKIAQAATAPKPITPAMPRMPMNPTAAMMAARQPRVVQAPPPMPRPRPVLAQPRQVQQQAPARPTTGGLLGLLFGGNTPSGPISVPGGNPNITHTDPGIVNPGSGREINGIDIAFMPKAVQQSSRWNTGY
jgi:hypothetical protein